MTVAGSGAASGRGPGRAWKGLLKDGRTVAVAVGPSRDRGSHHVEVAAFVDGMVVGHLLFNTYYQSAEDAWVAEGCRRNGVATAMYDALAAMGHAPQPSGDLTDDGKAFWRARRIAQMAQGAEAGSKPGLR